MNKRDHHLKLAERLEANLLKTENAHLKLIYNDLAKYHRDKIAEIDARIEKDFGDVLKKPE